MSVSLIPAKGRYVGSHSQNQGHHKLTIDLNSKKIRIEIGTENNGRHWRHQEGEEIHTRPLKDYCRYEKARREATSICYTYCISHAGDYIAFFMA